MSKKDRAHRSKPLALSGLMHSAMKRHHIGYQVTAAMVVEHAKSELQKALPPDIFADVHVVSYKFDQLYIACRFSEALHVVQPLLPGLKRQIEEDFPAITVKDIHCQYRPASWGEGQERW